MVRPIPTAFRHIPLTAVPHIVRIWDIAGTDQVLKLAVRPLGGRINDLSWDGESKRIIAVGDGRERFGAAFLADSGSSCGEIQGNSKVSLSAGLCERIADDPAAGHQCC